MVDLFTFWLQDNVNRGESVESAVVREVKEETGLEVIRYRFNRSKFYEKSNTLMVNFTAFVGSDAVVRTSEVDCYSWFSFDEAREQIKENSLAKEFLCAYLDE